MKGVCLVYGSAFTRTSVPLGHVLFNLFPFDVLKYFINFLSFLVNDKKFGADFESSLIFLVDQLHFKFAPSAMVLGYADQGQALVCLVDVYERTTGLS